MKELNKLSTEEKAKRYDEILARAEGANLPYYKEEIMSKIKEFVDYLLPELRESEEERIKKAIYNCVEWFGCDSRFFRYASQKDCLAWIEKQGEQKYTDKIEPKFHKGDKLISTRNPNLTYEVLEVGHINELGNPEYKVIIFADGKAKSPIDIHYLECKRVDEWAKLLEQNPADKVEPKFKVGNWYQCTKDFFGKGVTFNKNTAYYCAKEGCLQNEYGCHIAIVKDLYDNFKLWTLADTKDGDVLASDNGVIILVKESRNSPFGYRLSYHCAVLYDGKFELGEFHVDPAKFFPATKEQRNLLFQKMHEAGYEFDNKKKELKKIDEEIEEVNPEDYGIDGLYHAQRILEKTLGKVEGYQTDDGILDHKAAITTIKKLYEQKPTKWSKEDEEIVEALNDYVKNLDIFFSEIKICGKNIASKEFREKVQHWLNSIKIRNNRN